MKQLVKILILYVFLHCQLNYSSDFPASTLLCIFDIPFRASSLSYTFQIVCYFYIWSFLKLWFFLLCQHFQPFSDSWYSKHDQSQGPILILLHTVSIVFKFISMVFCCCQYLKESTSLIHLMPAGMIVYDGSVQFSCSVVSDSLRPHEPQHASPPCPSPTPGVYPNPCPLSQWCHPAISSSVIPFSSCHQSFPPSRSLPMIQLFVSGGQSIGVSASTSVLPRNTQDWSNLGWTGWISLQSKGLSRVLSNTTVQKHQFFGVQLSL